MTLEMPTPESLEAEANDLERRASAKERTYDYLKHVGGIPSETGLKDAAIFREEAASKRAKAERLRKAAQPLPHGALAGK